MEFPNVPITGSPKAVRISIPASVASDLGSFMKTFGSVMDKLGCSACCSGFEPTFIIERERFFSVNADLGVSPFGRLNPIFAEGQSSIISTKKVPLDSLEAVEQVLNNIDKQHGWKEVIANSRSVSFVTQDTFTVDMAGNVG